MSILPYPEPKDERMDRLMEMANDLAARIQAEKGRLAEALLRQYDAQGEIQKHQSLLAAANYKITESEIILNNLTDGNWSEADTNALKPIPHVPVQN